MEHVDSPEVLHHRVGAAHAVTQGDTLGREVGVADERVNVLHAEGPESEALACSGGFGGIPSVPVAPAEQVADFGNLPVAVRLQGDTALTQEYSILLADYSPEAETVGDVTGLLANEPFFYFVVGERAFVSIHHFRILQQGAQAGKVGSRQLP